MEVGFVGGTWIGRRREIESPGCWSHGRTGGRRMVRKRREAVMVQRYSGRDQMVDVDGYKICVDYFPGAAPTVVFLPGFFYARYQYAKSNALQLFCKRKGQGFLVHDYYGIGRSDGEFRDGTVTKWVEGTIKVMDEVLGRNSRCVLVGSGVGGWIMLHVAQLRPQNVVGLVGISADPDFTEDLLLPNLTDEQKRALETEGMIDMRWGMRTYPISKNLIEDGSKMLTLKGGPGSIEISCPVRLIQGVADEEIPAQRSLRLMECLASDDVTVTFVKEGDHVLENDDDFKRMWEAVCDVSDKYFEYDLTSTSSG